VQSVSGKHDASIIERDEALSQLREQLIATLQPALDSILENRALIPHFRQLTYHLFRNILFREKIFYFWRSVTLKCEVHGLRDLCDELMNFLAECGDFMDTDSVKRICTIIGYLLSKFNDAQLESEFVNKLILNWNKWEQPLVIKSLISVTVVRLRSHTAIQTLAEKSITLVQKSFVQQMHRQNNLEVLRLQGTFDDPNESMEKKVASRTLSIEFWSLILQLTGTWYMLLKRNPTLISRFLAIEYLQQNMIFNVIKFIYQCPVMRCSSIRVKLIDYLARLFELWKATNDSNASSTPVPETLHNYIKVLFDDRLYREANVSMRGTSQDDTPLLNQQPPQQSQSPPGQIEKTTIRPIREQAQAQAVLKLATCICLLDVPHEVFERSISYVFRLLFEESSGPSTRIATLKTLASLTNMCIERAQKESAQGVDTSTSSLHSFLKILKSIYHVIMYHIILTPQAVATLRDRLDQFSEQKRSHIVKCTAGTFAHALQLVYRVLEARASFKLELDKQEILQLPLFMERYLESLLFFVAEPKDTEHYRQTTIDMFVKICQSQYLDPRRVSQMMCRKLDLLFELMQLDELYVQLHQQLMTCGKPFSIALAECTLNHMVQFLSTHGELTSQQAQSLIFIIRGNFMRNKQTETQNLLVGYSYDLMKLIVDYQPPQSKTNGKDHILFFFLTVTFLAHRLLGKKLHSESNSRQKLVDDLLSTIAHRLRTVDNHEHQLYLQCLVNLPMDVRSYLHALPPLATQLAHVSCYSPQLRLLALQMQHTWITALSFEAIESIYESHLSDFISDLFLVEKGAANQTNHTFYGRIAQHVNKILYLLGPLVERYAFTSIPHSSQSHSSRPLKLAIRISEGESHAATRASVLHMNDLVSLSQGAVRLPLSQLNAQTSDDILAASFRVLQNCVSGMLELPETTVEGERSVDVFGTVKREIQELNHQMQAATCLHQSLRLLPVDGLFPVEFLESHQSPTFSPQQNTPKKSDEEYMDEKLRLRDMISSLFFYTEQKCLNSVAPRFVRQLCRHFILLTLFPGDKETPNASLRYVPTDVFFDALVSSCTRLSVHQHWMIGVLDDTAYLTNQHQHEASIRVIRAIVSRVCGMCFHHSPQRCFSAIKALHAIVQHMYESNFCCVWLLQHSLSIIHASFHALKQSSVKGLDAVTDHIVEIINSMMNQFFSSLLSKGQQELPDSLSIISMDHRLAIVDDLVAHLVEQLHSSCYGVRHLSFGLLRQLSTTLEKPVRDILLPHKDHLLASLHIEHFDVFSRLNFATKSALCDLVAFGLQSNLFDMSEVLHLCHYFEKGSRQKLPQQKVHELSITQMRSSCLEVFLVIVRGGYQFTSTPDKMKGFEKFRKMMVSTAFHYLLMVHPKITEHARRIVSVVKSPPPSGIPSTATTIPPLSLSDEEIRHFLSKSVFQEIFPSDDVALTERRLQLTLSMIEMLHDKMTKEELEKLAKNIYTYFKMLSSNIELGGVSKFDKANYALQCLSTFEYLKRAIPEPKKYVQAVFYVAMSTCNVFPFHSESIVEVLAKTIFHSPYAQEYVRVLLDVEQDLAHVPFMVSLLKSSQNKDLCHKLLSEFVLILPQTNSSDISERTRKQIRFLWVIQEVLHCLGDEPMDKTMTEECENLLEMLFSAHSNAQMSRLCSSQSVIPALGTIEWRKELSQVILHLSLKVKDYSKLLVMSFFVGDDHPIFRHVYRSFFVKHLPSLPVEERQVILSSLLNMSSDQSNRKSMWNIDNMDQRYLPIVLSYIIQPLIFPADTSQKSLMTPTLFSCIFQKLLHLLSMVPMATGTGSLITHKQMDASRKLDCLAVWCYCKLLIVSLRKIPSLSEISQIHHKTLLNYLQRAFFFDLTEISVIEFFTLSMRCVCDTGAESHLKMRDLLSVLTMQLYYFSCDGTKSFREPLTQYYHQCLKNLDSTTVADHLMQNHTSNNSLRDAVLTAALELKLLPRYLSEFIPVLRPLNNSLLSSGAPSSTLHALQMISNVLRALIQGHAESRTKEQSVTESPENDDVTRVQQGSPAHVGSKRLASFQLSTPKLKRQKLSLMKQEEQYLMDVLLVFVNKFSTIFGTCTKKRKNAADASPFSEYKLCLTQCIVCMRELLEHYDFLRIDTRHVMSLLDGEQTFVAGAQLLELLIEYLPDALVDIAKRLTEALSAMIASTDPFAHECLERILDRLMSKYPPTSPKIPVPMKVLYSTVLKKITSVLALTKSFNLKHALLILPTYRIICEHSSTKSAPAKEDLVVRLVRHFLSSIQSSAQDARYLNNAIAVCAECLSVLDTPHVHLLDTILPKHSNLEPHVIAAFMGYASKKMSSHIVESKHKIATLRSLRVLHRAQPKVRNHFCKALHQFASIPLFASNSHIQASKEFSSALMEAALACDEPEQRKPLLEHLLHFVPSTLSGCFTFIFTPENWAEHLGETWLRVSAFFLIHRVVSSDSVQIVASKIKYSLRTIDTKRKSEGYNETSSHTLSILRDYQDFVETLQEMDLDELMENLRTILLCGSSTAVHIVWRTFFSSCFSLLPEDISTSVQNQIISFISQPRIKSGRTVSLILEGLLKAENTDTLSPELLSFFATNQCAWDSSLPLLERIVFVAEENTHTVAELNSNLQEYDRYCVKLSELYERMGETSLWRGVWRFHPTVSKYSQSLLASAQFERWNNVQTGITHLVQNENKKADPISNFEPQIWESLWFTAAKHLQQWREIEIASKDCCATSQLFEAASNVQDWSTIRDLVSNYPSVEHSAGPIGHWMLWLQSWSKMTKNASSEEVQRMLAQRISLAGHIHRMQSSNLPNMHCNAILDRLSLVQSMFEIKEESAFFTNNLSVEDLNSLLNLWKQQQPAPHTDDMLKWNSKLTWRVSVMSKLAKVKPQLKDASSILSSWASNQLVKLARHHFDETIAAFHLEQSRKILHSIAHLKIDENVEFLCEAVGHTEQKSGTAEAVKLLDSANMKRLKTSQQAELLCKRGRLLSKMNKSEDASREFSRAASCIRTTFKSKKPEERDTANFQNNSTTLSNVFLSWFLHLRECPGIAQNQQNRIEAIHCFLYALKASTPRNTVIMHIPRLILLLGELEGTKKETSISSLIDEVPTHLWIPHIPSLIASLKRRPLSVQYYVQILLRVVNFYPQSIFFSLNATMLELLGTSGGTTSKTMNHIQLLINHFKNQENSVYFPLYSMTQELRKPGLSSTEMEEVCRFVHIIVERLSSIAPSHSVPEPLLVMVQRIPSLLIATSVSLSNLFAKNEIPTEIFSAQQPNVGIILPYLRVLYYALRNMCLRTIPSSMRLYTLSKKLSDFRTTGIELPGQYQMHPDVISPPIIEQHTHILQFDPKVRILLKHSDTNHRELHVACFDGSVSRFFIRSNPLTESNKNLQSHARFQDFLRQWATLLRTQQNIRIQPLWDVVVRISPETQLIQCHSSLVTLRDLAENHALKTHQQADQFTSLYWGTIEEGNAQQALSVMESTIPSDLLSNYVKNQVFSWSTYFNLRKAFTIKFAISSVFAHLFRVEAQNAYDELRIDHQSAQFSDCTSRMHLNTSNGKLMLKKSNRTMRLSPNVAAFISPVGLWGPFFDTMAATLLAMKRNKETLRYAVELFMYDELTDWLASKTNYNEADEKQVEAQISQISRENTDTVFNAIDNLIPPSEANVSLAVEKNVNEAIEQLIVDAKEDRHELPLCWRAHV